MKGTFYMEQHNGDEYLHVSQYGNEPKGGNKGNAAVKTDSSSYSKYLISIPIWLSTTT